MDGSGNLSAENSASKRSGRMGDAKKDNFVGLFLERLLSSSMHVELIVFLLGRICRPLFTNRDNDDAPSFFLDMTILVCLILRSSFAFIMYNGTMVDS